MHHGLIGAANNIHRLDVIEIVVSDESVFVIATYCYNENTSPGGLI